MDVLLQPTPCRMPPRAEPPTQEQELQTLLQMAVERKAEHERYAAAEDREIKRLKRRLKQLGSRG